ncbi:hypothetical protein D9758_001469 [Tetrapyrgos nigripes]|uniref:Inactive metallocarboxypeptidase ECM14 n=1 Tax=Tetrapyrgos nigripes TaxID=182062 RepID=A0A8H5LX75_9AGAR|nr:hypothetical protein D9758_001469 [Tetrapyrgos nigripes]
MALKSGLLTSILFLCARTILADSTQQVLTAVPNSLNRTGTLHKLSLKHPQDLDNVVKVALSHDLDIWRITPSEVDIYVPSAQTDYEQVIPQSLKWAPRTVTPIYHSNAPTNTLSTSNLSQWNLSSLTNTSYHSAYHPLFEIDSFISEMVQEFPDEVSVVQLGHSAEGREMLGLKLARSPPVQEKHRDKGDKGNIRQGNRALDPDRKLGFVITGAQHAREWIATATTLYLAHALVANKTEDGSLSHLLDTFDFYIIPAPNPDGYAYTWETDRFWYKNRQIMGPNAKCVGLDMNRNWGYKWKRVPVGGGPTLDNDDDDFSKKEPKDKEPVDPCSHWYPGHRPFESPEVNNIGNYMTTIPNLVGFIDLRSYGQMLSLPYSFSCKRVPKDAEDMMEAALGAVKALRNVHGTEFSTGTLCQLLYKAPGNVIDWMYKKKGIKYTYAVHLRDTGTYGFSLPAQWIRPVGEETGNMIAYLATFISKQLRRS